MFIYLVITCRKYPTGLYRMPLQLSLYIFGNYQSIALTPFINTIIDNYEEIAFNSLLSYAIVCSTGARFYHYQVWS
jgi:hypothetical protein